MRLLLTNDDGIQAPGLTALVRATRSLGELHVSAPELPQSACGHGISVLKPLAAHRIRVHDEFDGFSVDGKPADCVKLALQSLLKERPDVVLSGINAGVNTGTNVLYSGTVSAALEACMQGIPSIAFSLELSDQMDFAFAGRVARQIVECFMDALPLPTTCWSVNIPAVPPHSKVAVRIAKQSCLHFDDAYHQQADPRGRPVYWLDGTLPHEAPSACTDLSGVLEKCVTITPLKIDLTDHDALQRLATQSNLPSEVY